MDYLCIGKLNLKIYFIVIKTRIEDIFRYGFSYSASKIWWNDFCLCKSCNVIIYYSIVT